MTLPITFWYGIRPEFICRERLVEAMEAGFNLIECDFDTETNLRVLDWCAELGLKANVRDPRIDIALAGDDGWETVMEEMMADYKGHPALHRFFLRDEPISEYFPALGRVAARLHENGLREYINLLPSCPFASLDEYRKHVTDFLEIVKPTVLSYDHYNLKKVEVKTPGDRPEARVSKENRTANALENILYEAIDTPNFYDNLEIIRAEAIAAGLPWMLIVLLTEHWHYRWVTEAEVRWEIFTALAYGTHAMSYFTYWAPGGHFHSLIRADGTRDEAYDMITRLNAELQTVYGALSLPYPGEANAPEGKPLSEAVFHVGPEADVLVKDFVGYGQLTEIKTDGRLVVGCYGGGRFILVNKDHDHPVTMTALANAPLWLLNKATGAWEACDGHITLAAGDGTALAIGS